MIELVTGNNRETPRREHALGALDIALKTLTAAYTNNKRNAWGASEFFIETIPFPPRDFAALEDFARTVSKSLEQIQERLILLAIGVDFRKYVRFRMLAPHARADGDKVVFYNVPDDDSEDGFEFCIGFVIETALTLQEADYEVRHAERPGRFDFTVRDSEATQGATAEPEAEPSAPENAGADVTEQAAKD